MIIQVYIGYPRFLPLHRENPFPFGKSSHLLVGCLYLCKRVQEARTTNWPLPTFASKIPLKTHENA